MTVMTDDFATFLRTMAGLTIIAVLGAVVTLAVFGFIELHDTIWPPHPLVCVAAHDEFHQTDNGITVRVCTSYRRA